jgi:hypothetical protein
MVVVVGLIGVVVLFDAGCLVGVVVLAVFIAHFFVILGDVVTLHTDILVFVVLVVLVVVVVVLSFALVVVGVIFMPKLFSLLQSMLVISLPPAERA